MYALKKNNRGFEYAATAASIAKSADRTPNKHFKGIYFLFIFDHGKTQYLLPCAAFSAYFEYRLETKIVIV